MECCKNIVIRKAEPKDFKEIVLMSQKLADERKIVSNEGKEYVENGNDRELETLKLCDNKMMSCVVAEYSNGSSAKCLVGYVFYNIAYSSGHGKHIRLCNFFVESSKRNKGIGSCLFDHVTKVLLNESFIKFRLIVGRWEESGRKFFEKKRAENTISYDVVYYVMPRKCLENLAKDEVTTLDLGKEEITFRMALPDDCPKLLKLIMDLFHFTNFGDISLSVEQLKKDLFESEPSFLYNFVAEKIVKGSGRKEIIGMVMYYPFYSMLNEKCLYLEGIHIDEPYRREGIGSQFFKHLGKFAVENECKSMEFVALAWNEPSIKFYEKKGCIDVTTQQNLDLYFIHRKDLLK